MFSSLNIIYLQIPIYLWIEHIILTGKKYSIFQVPKALVAELGNRNDAICKTWEAER